MAAFNLLEFLFIRVSDENRGFIDFAVERLKRGRWRLGTVEKWSIQTMQTARNETGFAGIDNLGNICYMNSILQQLYLIPEFSNAILGLSTAPGPSPKDNMLYQLQFLFGRLQNSQKMYADPTGFCYAFKDYAGNPTNIYNQMDV